MALKIVYVLSIGIYEKSYMCYLKAYLAIVINSGQIADSFSGVLGGSTCNS